jgi:4-amino-4-deoxy-L-arabinose transferase-like glycosyltransferase
LPEHAGTAQKRARQGGGAESVGSAPAPRFANAPAPLWPIRDADPAARTPWAALIGLTVLAIVLRAIGIDGALWYDEIRTLLDSVRAPLEHILTVFPGNNQHTLYSVLAHVSITAFGEAPWSLRLPALIFGAATPAVLYLFAREFVGRAEALLAGLLLAVSYHHVWFSQNARGYSALAFFALLTSWLLLRGLRRGRRSDFVWYGLASALGVYTHLTMVFLVIGHAVACAVLLGMPVLSKARSSSDEDALRRWHPALTGFVVAALTALALYAPLLLDVQQFFLKRPLRAELATPAWAAKAMLSGLRVGAGTALVALVGLGLFICGLWSYFRQSRFLTALFVLPGVITVAAVLALRQPIFPRFLFFLAGFGVLIVVRGALEIGALLTRRWKPAGTSMNVAGVALVVLMALASTASLAFDYRFPKQDFAGALQFVQAQRADGEPIATAGPAIYVYREYYKLPWEGVRSREELLKLRAQGRRVWVIYTLSEFIETGAPDLMQTLRGECDVAGVFRGTVAGGDVTVCVLPPIGPAAKSSAVQQ